EPPAANLLLKQLSADPGNHEVERSLALARLDQRRNSWSLKSLKDAGLMLEPRSNAGRDLRGGERLHGDLAAFGQIGSAPRLNALPALDQLLKTESAPDDGGPIFLNRGHHAPRRVPPGSPSNRCRRSLQR